MNKKDLTKYSNDELSLQVFNTESLYWDRHKPLFLQDINELFVFTKEQLEVLKKDLFDDKKDEVDIVDLLYFG